MKHRILALLLAAAMLTALPACGGNADSDVPNDSPAVADTASPAPEDSAPVQSDSPAVDTTEPEDVPEPTDVPEEEPEEPSDAVSEPAPPPSPSAAPSQAPSPSPSTAPSQAPEPSPGVQPSPEPEPEPSPEPAPEPSQGGSVDLQAFYESLSENEEFNARMPVEGEFLTMFYPGLSDIATKQRVIYMPMMSAVVCEIALVEVENAGDVQAVKDIFQARIDSQVGTDDEPGGAFYPASIDGWKNNSRIVSNGNCVMMIVWSGCDSVTAAFDGLF